METGKVNIHGKEYLTVAYRIKKFREDHPVWTVDTTLIYHQPDVVVVRAVIIDQDGRVLATGHAEEFRASSTLNETSAIENAETSAVGRALAFLGYTGSEIASADEIEIALRKQQALRGSANPEKPTGAQLNFFWGRWKGWLEGAGVSNDEEQKEIARRLIPDLKKLTMAQFKIWDSPDSKPLLFKAAAEWYQDNGNGDDIPAKILEGLPNA